MTERKSLKSRHGGFLGPVADLENHLPEDWWRELFDALYLQTDADVAENDVNTANEVDLVISTTGIQPADRILDLCCGQGRHALELARRGFGKVTGADRSRYLIRVARRRAKKLGLPVTFFERDARTVRFPKNSFDCVLLMGNSFGYFEREEQDLKVLGNVARMLRPGGTFVLDITDGDWMRNNFEARSWEWIDENHFVCRERSLSADKERLVSRELISHADRGVIADRFYAERMYSQERLFALLGEAGFRDIRLHDRKDVESSRGQDLGMMGHRLFLTSVAPRREEVVPTGARAAHKVTVVMGDPRLPDPVKRSGKFNEEDFVTIERLKDALSELDDYQFDYLDNHATLLNDLRSLTSDFILNLCDEGLNNDAFKELHVPAMMEVFGIPYTGAGPSCLGLCYDKALVRAVANALDIPVPHESFYRPTDQSASLPSVFPAIIKPNFGDSSIGITKDAVVKNTAELMNYLTQVRELLPDRPLLVQEFLPGTECTVGLVGNPETGLHALPILEVDYSGLRADMPQILGYESKWLPDSPYWTQIGYKETNVDADIQRQLIDWSSALFQRLDCRDYARFDFRADIDGNMKLLEVNPNPGWCWDGKFNLMASMADMTYADLLHMILEAARERVAIARKAAAKNAA